MVRKNKKVKSHHPYLKLSILALAAISIVGLGYFLYQQRNSSPKKDGPTAEEVEKASQIEADTKKGFIESEPSKESSTQQPAVESQTSSIELTAKQEADSTVTLLSKLPGISSGTCTVNIANGSKSIERMAEIIFQPNFSTCAGFSIPIDDLGKGSWNIELTVVSGSKNVKKSTTLEVI